MIEIEHLNKTYPSPGGDIHALRTARSSASSA